MGDITGNLAGRRARISGTESLRGNLVTIRADIPLSSLSDYHTELKSLTQGQGTYTMEFSHYDPVPSNVQQQLIRDHKPKDND
jgi:elongation factor G